MGLAWGEEDWRNNLPILDRGNPPYMMGLSKEQIERGVISGSEIKSIDVIKLDGKIIYTTWCGRIFLNSDAAVDDFILVNAEYENLKGKEMYSITNSLIIRYLGDFTKAEFDGISERMYNRAMVGFYYPADQMILFNGKWRGSGIALEVKK